MYTLPSYIQQTVDMVDNFYNKNYFPDWSADIEPVNKEITSDRNEDLFASDVDNSKLVTKLASLTAARKKVICPEINRTFVSLTECADYFNLSVARLSMLIKNGTTFQNKYTFIRG